MAITAARYNVPFATAFDSTGIVSPGALLYFYETGSSNPATTYSNSALTIPNSNPVQANGAGLFPSIFLTPYHLYKVVLETSDGDEIWTADPVFADSPYTTVTFSFTTTAVLLAAFGAGLSLPNGVAATTSGRNTIGDGGGGTFYYNSSDTTSADNGGTIRVDAQNRRWFYSGNSPTVALFGAFPDGSDAATGFNLAAAAFPDGILLIPGDTGDTYTIQSTITLATATTALGMRAISGTPTIKAGNLFSGSTDMVTMGGQATPRSWQVLANISFDANNKARRCVTMLSGNYVDYTQCSFSNTLAEGIAFTCTDVSGSPQWVEKLNIAQCNWQTIGTDAILFSLAGTTGAFINEVIFTGGRLSGISKVANGGHMIRFSSSATLGSSTMTNFVLIKPHFDVQYASGQPTTPSSDVINCDSGALSNITLINPQVENTGSGSLASGYLLNKSGSGSVNGARGISVSNNSGYGILGFNSSVTDAAIDSYSFATETLRGPANTNTLRGQTASLAAAASANLFSTPATTPAVYLVSATGGDGSPTYTAAAIVSTDGAGTWNVAYTSGSGTHVQFIGSGTTLTIKNVDLSANTFVWSAIRQI